jgi:hypothetical protein
MSWLQQAAHVARKKEIRNAYTIFAEKFQRKIQHGKPRCRWQYNIKQGLREEGCESLCGLCQVKVQRQLISKVPEQSREFLHQRRI